MIEIEIKDLVKKYGSSVVLDIPSLDIQRGEIVGVVGNNGAGKTTLLRLANDLLRPTEGTVSIKDVDVSKSEDWKTRTSAFIDNGFLIDFLMPEEYFSFLATAYSISEESIKQTLDSLHEFLRDEVLGKSKYIRDYSVGNRQKVGIAGALISKPDVLMLDEPFNYLDPSSQFFIRSYLRKLNQTEGTTMIVSSHNLELVYELSTRIIVLDKGKIIKDLSTAEASTRTIIDEYFDVKENHPKNM